MACIVAMFAGLATLTLATGAATGGLPTPGEIASSAGLDDASAWMARNRAWAFALGAAGALVWLGFFAKALRPGGLDGAGGARRVDGVPAVLWLFAAVSVVLLQSLAIDLVRRAIDLDAFEEVLGGVKVDSVLGAGAGLIGVTAALGMAALLARGGGKDSGLSFRGRDVPVGVGLLVVMYPIIALTGTAAGWIAARFFDAPAARIAHDTLSDIVAHRGNPWAWGLVLAAVVAAPVVEELVYRGMLQSAARRVLGSAWAAVLATATVFTLIHWSIVPAGSRHQLLMLFVLAVGLGAAFERTKSIGVPIVMHAGFNLLNVVMALG